MIQSSADDSDWSDDDDDDEGISTQERLSIEIGSIHTTDPPFEEEYEVPSDSGSSIEETYFPHQVQDFQGYFPPQTKLRVGNVFIGVCLSGGCR